LILKDELLPKKPENGREQATISYEYDFQSSVHHVENGTTEDIPWAKFKPTYRGKEKKDAAPLDPSNIKRISIMMRRYICFSAQRYCH